MSVLGDLVAPDPSALPLVRAATAADHPAIRQVLLAAFGPYAGTMDPRVFLPYLSDLLDLDRHASHGELLVAEVGGRVRGFGAFYPDIGRQRVGWPPGWAGGRGLAVHPSARHHGVARTLLAASEARAREHGAPVFAFHTVSLMSAAVALYQGLGYRRAPEFDIDLAAHYGVRTAVRTTAIAYRRDLVPSPATTLLEVPMTRTLPRRTQTPAYYLGRPASFWLESRNRRRPPALRPVD